MEWTGLNELREKFLSFYESKGHLRLPSFSLIPQGDKSLLLINAGMSPMKNILRARSPRREQELQHVRSVSERPISRMSEKPRVTEHILKCSAISPSAIILSMMPLHGHGNSAPR